ncbi:hypothetical protein N7532_010446 [Penicillium argentinense]|uniref:Methyltransferase domain-containing protein n=1 Tax=Penicillium argentinense TaxID=1131581 RepID=A0A9W9EPV1_9EURO|nr:uncharacterized protein N7532_010446 [Penicillium argentinense]KAJ5085675.1 hypothetical protein N7532_010446 [Penicillium argentinense]
MSFPIDSTQIKEDMRKAYNSMATTYLTWTEPTHKTRLEYLQKLLKKMDSSIRPGESQNILELGCGAGIPCTKLLANRPNTRVTGNDISDVQIALAKERLVPSENNLTLVQGDMMNLAFPPKYFTAVLAMYSIIHLPRAEQSTILGRIYDWLEPGGLFLANFGTAESRGASDEGWLGGKDGSVYWSSWGKEELRRILGEVGFVIEVDEVVVDTEEFGGVTKGVEFQWILARKENGTQGARDEVEN